MTNDKDYKNKIEALLFASGRFMDVQTLLNLTGASNKNVLIKKRLSVKKVFLIKLYFLSKVNCFFFSFFEFFQ